LRASFLDGNLDWNLAFAIKRIANAKGITSPDRERMAFIHEMVSLVGPPP